MNSENEKKDPPRPDDNKKQDPSPFLRIVTARAPGLLPSLIAEIRSAEKPVVLVPESFTLACETEIVNRSADHGIFDLPIFSPSSLVREIRELTGRGSKKPIPADGQNMIIARVLHHRQEELKYYRDSVGQPALAQKIANQINEFSRARLTPGFLKGFQPAGRRAKAKVEDMALVWDNYLQLLGDRYEDMSGQWLSALSRLDESGLLRNARLLIYGFDYITHDLLSLMEAAVSGTARPAEIVIGLVSDGESPDREIFRSANDSVQALKDYLEQHPIMPFRIEPAPEVPPADPGIAYVEKTFYAADAEVPDLSHVRAYYAKNSYLECQHACQTLIGWHEQGIPWEDMAVAVCEQDTLPSLLPLTLSAAGIPFNAKQDRPILMSGYAQYFLSLLRIMRLNFRRDDVIRMMKTGFTALTAEEVMDMENYARQHGVHRERWLRPFHIPEAEKEKEKAERMEAHRKRFAEPIVALRAALSKKSCTGRQAATLLFQFVTENGVYDRLLAIEEELAARGDDPGIDRNRQVWTAINGLLDSVAVFVGDEPLPLSDLCAMLEASLAGKSIKSLPQLSHAVTVAPPQMFFSSGVRCMLVMGLQENEISSGGGILSEHERGQLEQFIQEENRKYYQGTGPDQVAEIRPFSRIGQSAPELAARQKQDIYQAVSLAREQLALSASGARPNGGVLTQSVAFRRLHKLLTEQCPENASGGLADADLRPFAPSFALEALAIRLREARGQADSFLRSDSEEDLLWRDALRALYHSEKWKARTEGVLDGLRVALPESGLTPEQAGQIYLGRPLSISRMETFSTCPRQHLLTYGLDLFPNPEYRFEPNEKGNFNHDIIRRFLEIAMRQPEWPDLTDRQVDLILSRVIGERTKQWEGGILRSDILHRYTGIRMIRGVRVSIEHMMRSFRMESHFLPVATEVPFGMADEGAGLRLPAIPIRLADGSTVAFSGRIDRLDRLKTPEGKTYYMIIDNKMSSREVRQNSLVAGLQLQLPLYMLAAERGLPDGEIAGGLYQPIRDPQADSEEPEIIRAKIDADLRTTGIILDDERIQAAMAPVKASKRSESNDTVGSVSPEEIRALEACSERVIADRVARMYGGETDPKPIMDGTNSPCAWCDHADACRFDSTLPGCAIPELDHKHRMDLTASEV